MNLETVLTFLTQDNQQKAKGYGFVTFEDVQAATDCLNFDNHVFDNKPIAVKVSFYEHFTFF